MAVSKKVKSFSNKNGILDFLDELESDYEE